MLRTQVTSLSASPRFCGGGTDPPFQNGVLDPGVFGIQYGVLSLWWGHRPTVSRGSACTLARGATCMAWRRAGGSEGAQGNGACGRSEIDASCRFGSAQYAEAAARRGRYVSISHVESSFLSLLLPNASIIDSAQAQAKKTCGLSACRVAWASCLLRAACCVAPVLPTVLAVALAHICGCMS